MQEPIALPHPALRVGWRRTVRERIMGLDLAGDHALIAMSLLVLSNEETLQVSVSSWVAQQMFDQGPQEWDACLADLTAAGLVDVSEENQQRVRITWKAEL